MKNKISFLVIVFVFISCNTKNINNSKHEQIVKKNSRIYKYNNNDIIEEIDSLGTFDLKSKEYKVYNCFRKIKTADNYKGQSLILFLSEMDTLIYLLDSKEDLPDSLVYGSLFVNGNSTKVDELSNPICFNNECFELQNLNDSIILSLKLLR